MSDPLNTTLTIPDGQTASQELDLTYNSGRASWRLIIFSPATMTETVNLQSAPVAGTNGPYSIVRTSQTVITLAAGTADQLMEFTGQVIRLHSTTAVSGDKVFRIQGVPFVPCDQCDNGSFC